MTQHCVGKNYKELTIKIYVDARQMKDPTSHRTELRYAQRLYGVFVLIVIIALPHDW